MTACDEGPGVGIGKNSPPKKEKIHVEDAVWKEFAFSSLPLLQTGHSTQVGRQESGHRIYNDKGIRERSEWQVRSTPPSTRPIARWCAALSKRRLSPTPTNGTRPAGFRGGSMRRPPESGRWA